MSDANLASIAYAPESSLGSPVTALQEIRYTRENLKFEKEAVSSAEIRSDRQVPDNQKVYGQPIGSFDFELSFLAFLPWIAGAMQADWIDLNITASVSLDNATQIASGTASTFNDVPVGAIVKIAGATSPANNGPKRVIAKASNGSKITLAPGSIITTDGATSLTFTGKHISNGVTRKSFFLEKRILNSDGEDFYQTFRGMVVDSLTLNIESKALITGTVGLVGTEYEIADSGTDSTATDPETATGVLTLTGNAVADETITIGGMVYTFVLSATDPGDVEIGGSASITIDNLIDEILGDGIGEANPLVLVTAGAGDTMDISASSTGALGNSIATTETMTNGSFASATLTGGVSQSAGYSAATLGPVMNGTNNMGTIRMDGTEATDRFKTITLAIANNLRGKDALGFDGNFDIGMGQFAVTGNLNAYFRNNQLPTKVRNHTTFGLEFFVQDAEGNRLYFYIPAVKPPSGDPVITGINTDVMLDTQYQAILGGTENPTGKTLLVDAIPA